MCTLLILSLTDSCPRGCELAAGRQPEHSPLTETQVLADSGGCTPGAGQGLRGGKEMQVRHWHSSHAARPHSPGQASLWEDRIQGWPIRFPILGAQNRACHLQGGVRAPCHSPTPSSCAMSSDCLTPFEYCANVC